MGEYKEGARHGLRPFRFLPARRRQCDGDVLSLRPVMTNGNVMKKVLWFMAALLAAAGAQAQGKGFSFRFYGQVRADLFYNSRANEETVDGLFYMYPKDVEPDADGRDLNATPNGSFYVLYTRLGVDFTGSAVGKARTSAKIEADFRGSGTDYSLPRIRQAYVQLDWAGSSLLVGQTWHPLYGDVAPQVMNLSTGAPFQPFSRAPMARYRYSAKGVQATVAAVWQSQYLSAGPAGKSRDYLKHSCVPEVYAGVDYRRGGWLAGAGVEVLSLVPRTQSEVEGRTYKVDERVTSVSCEAHVKYTGGGWMAAAKTLLANNLTQTSMLGGYGVTAIDARTGQREYAPLRHSSTWVNVVYGSRWRPGIFAGYMKNLGTGKALASGELYGTGTDVDQLATGGVELTYNLPHWKVGAEYTYSAAWYGALDRSNGRITGSRSVGNHRGVVSVLYMF